MSSEMVTATLILSFLYSVIRMATPLVYGSLGAIISYRAGSDNLAIEATMTISAMVGCITSIYVKSMGLAIVLAMAAGVLLSLFLAFMFLKLEANCTMTCVALNNFTTGLAMFLPFVLFKGSKGSTMGQNSMKFASIEVPILKDIPVLGDIFSGHSILTYLSVVVVFLVWFIIFKTSFGLRMRAAGENAESAMSVGINVYKTKMSAYVLTGMVSSLGGLFMSMYYLSWFTARMVAGRGFIAVSICNLTGARPFLALLFAAVFGAIDALALTLQSAFNFPAELLQMLPYIATIIGVTLVSSLEVKRQRKLQAQRR